MQADIKGIVVGQVGTFTGVPDPPGSALQAGNIPTWLADDPNVALTPAADGSSVAAQTSATDTATSFNLTQSGVSSDGTKISTTVNVANPGVAGLAWSDLSAFMANKTAPPHRCAGRWCRRGHRGPSRDRGIEGPRS